MPAPKPAPSPPPPPAPLPPPPPGSHVVEIRLALSAPAARTLAEPRLRRLVEIETEDVAVLSPTANGPLGDHVAYVWVDQPAAAKIVVEMRVGDRPVERREVAIGGLAPDVAARLVAIAISRMLRAGMAPRPAPPPPPSPPHRPTPEEIERASRTAPALLLMAEGAVAGLPGSSGVLGGAGLSLGFRYFGATESIFGRWLTGPTRDSPVRWLELGLAADYRFWLHPSWRLSLGGAGAFSSIELGDATGVEAQPGQRSTWSARAGGVVGVEARLAAPIWLALTLEPGAILRPVHFTVAGGGSGVVQGAWLGVGLGVRFEKVRAGEVAAVPP